MTFDACVKNTGGTPLTDINAILNLTDAGSFGTAFVGVVEGIEFIESNAQTDPVINTDYNGTGNLFAGNGLMYPGEQICVRFTIEVTTEEEAIALAAEAQLEISAKAVNFEGEPIPDFDNGGAQFMPMDLSDDGMDPMTNNPGSPGDTGGEDDATPLTDCWKINEELTSNDNLHATLSADCEVLVTADDVLENHFAKCDMSTYPLAPEDDPFGTYDGYYRIELFDSNGDGQLPNPIDATKYHGQEIVVKIVNVAFNCEPTWGIIVFEDKTEGDACIRKVVALHKTEGTVETEEHHGNEIVTSIKADYFLTDSAPKEIGGKYYFYEPVTSEDVECNDMILDKDYLADPNTNLLTCIEVDSILNVKQSWTDKSYAYYTGSPELFDNCGVPTITKVL